MLLFNRNKVGQAAARIRWGQKDAIMTSIYTGLVLFWIIKNSRWLSIMAL